MIWRWLPRSVQPSRLSPPRVLQACQASVSDTEHVNSSRLLGEPSPSTTLCLQIHPIGSDARRFSECKANDQPAPAHTLIQPPLSLLQLPLLTQTDQAQRRKTKLLLYPSLFFRLPPSHSLSLSLSLSLRRHSDRGVCSLLFPSLSPSLPLSLPPSLPPSLDLPSLL